MRRIALPMLTALAGALAACGGSGGSGSSFRPEPTPAPAPAPTPTPTPTPGYEPPTLADIIPLPEEGEAHEIVGYSLGIGDDGATSGFAIEYDAEAQSYTLTLPGFEAGQLVAGEGGDEFNGASISDPASPGEYQSVSVITRNLRGSASWCVCSNAGFYFDWGNSRRGAFAVGTRAELDEILPHGTAVFELELAGAVSNSEYFFVGGDGQLTFNVTTSELSGQFEPILYEMWSGGAKGLGIYHVAEGIFGVDTTDFSGSLFHADGGYDGQFVGFFTANGYNVIGTWEASYYNDMLESDGVIYGAFVGFDNSGP